MKLSLDPNEKTGLYLGSEIDEKWWRRYTKDGFLARGNGRYWHDAGAFYFLRYLTEEPIAIPFNAVMEFKIGKWHSGKWCFGCPVLKIIWFKERIKLSSGFLVSKDRDAVEKIISELKNDAPSSSCPSRSVE